MTWYRLEFHVLLIKAIVQLVSYFLLGLNISPVTINIICGDSSSRTESRLLSAGITTKNLCHCVVVKVRSKIVAKSANLEKPYHHTDNHNFNFFVTLNILLSPRFANVIKKARLIQKRVQCIFRLYLPITPSNIQIIIILTLI